MVPTIIWGAILLLLGLSLLIRTLFGVSGHLIKIGIGAACMYAGIIMINSPEHAHLLDQKSVAFSKEYVKIVSPLDVYTINFAQADLDFSAMETPKEPRTLTIKNLLGVGTIRLNPAIPTKLTVNSMGAHTQLPDGSSHFWGKTTYKTNDANKALLELEVENTLGQLKIV